MIPRVAPRILGAIFLLHLRHEFLHQEIFIAHFASAAFRKRVAAARRQDDKLADLSAVAQLLNDVPSAEVFSKDCSLSPVIEHRVVARLVLIETGRQKGAGIRRVDGGALGTALGMGRERPPRPRQRSRAGRPGSRDFALTSGMDASSFLDSRVERIPDSGLDAQPSSVLRMQRVQHDVEGGWHHAEKSRVATRGHAEPIWRVVCTSSGQFAGRVLTSSCCSETRCHRDRKQSVVGRNIVGAGVNASFQ